MEKLCVVVEFDSRGDPYAGVWSGARGAILRALLGRAAEFRVPGLVRPTHCFARFSETESNHVGHVDRIMLQVRYAADR